MRVASKPGSVATGNVGVAPRATTIHAATATASAAAAIVTYVALEHLTGRRSSIRVRNSTMRLDSGAMVARCLRLRKWSPEDLHVVRTPASIDCVAGAHLGEGRVED